MREGPLSNHGHHRPGKSRRSHFHPVKPFAVRRDHRSPFDPGQWLKPTPSQRLKPTQIGHSIDAATPAARGRDEAFSVDSVRGFGKIDKIGTVGSTYFSEIEKVVLEQGRSVGAGRGGA